MNKEAALRTRSSLRMIIDAYEKWNRSQIATSSKRVTAAELLLVSDVSRSVLMADVARTRLDRILNGGKPIQPSSGAPPISTATNSLLEEGTRLAAAAAPSPAPPPSESEDFWRDWKDCIPCNKEWDWGDFDFDMLKDLLNLDLDARFAFLEGLDLELDTNPVLEQLCLILNAFKNLCPQDLLVLIAMLVAFIESQLAAIIFNLDGILKDILSTLLRPYIAGLENFLNAYLQHILSQMDCILNLVTNSLEIAQDLHVGPFNKGPDSWHIGRQELTDEKTDQVLDAGAQWIKRQRAYADRKARSISDYIANEIPAALLGKRPETAEDSDSAKELDELTGGFASSARNFVGYLGFIIATVRDDIESKLQKAQDFLIDILGGEWLVTNRNLTLAQQVKIIATLIDILQIIYKLGAGEELCTEDNLRKFIKEFNDGDTGPKIYEDFTPPEPDTTTGNAAARQRAGVSARQANLAPSADGVRPALQIPLSLSACMKAPTPSEQALLRRFMQELTR